MRPLYPSIIVQLTVSYRTNRHSIITRCPKEQYLVYQSRTRISANGELDNDTWIEWAHGIWLGIQESDTLSYARARDAEDEKHICPLQLGTIERCIKLYSNKGELICDPFAGIGDRKSVV